MNTKCARCNSPLLYQKTSNGSFLQTCPTCNTQAFQPTTPYFQKKSSVPVIAGIVLSFALLALSIIAVIIWSNRSSEPLSNNASVQLSTSPVYNVEAEINNIKNLYYPLQDILPQLKINYHNQYKVYKNEYGQVKRVDFTDSARNTNNYYYENDKLYFVFSYNNNEENRYYIYQDTLFRWNHNKQAIYDNAFDNNEYMEKYQSIISENNLIVSQIINKN